MTFFFGERHSLPGIPLNPFAFEKEALHDDNVEMNSFCLLTSMELILIADCGLLSAQLNGSDSYADCGLLSAHLNGADSYSRLWLIVCSPQWS